eukprot:jgi/Bigna1/88253/estExt_fgenesh1_pg.C_290173
MSDRKITEVAPAQSPPAARSESKYVRGGEIIPDKTVHRGGGIEIKYVDLGPQDGEPVLLIHGFLMSANSMWGQCNGITDALLESGFRVIAADSRGFGISSKPYQSDKYGKHTITDLIAVLDACQVQQCHVVGYSMGSEMALYLTCNFKRYVKSLCIGGSGWADAEQVTFYTNTGHCCFRNPHESCPPPGPFNPFFWARVCWYICCCPCCLAPLLCDGETPDLRAALVAFKAHGLELCDLPASDLENIKVTVLGISGELDPEIKFLERMQGVVPDYSLTVLDGLDHKAADTKAYRDTVVGFLKKMRNGGSDGKK